MKFLPFVVFLLGTQCLFAQTADLILTFTNIKEVKGTILVGIYTDPATFPKADQEYKVVKVKVTSMQPSFKIEDLPVGTYAIALVKDDNGNGHCDMNFIGMPTEAYGFSNNAKPGLKAPSFESAKFLLNQDRTMSIRLQY